MGLGSSLKSILSSKHVAIHEDPFSPPLVDVQGDIFTNVEAENRVIKMMEDLLSGLGSPLQKKVDWGSLLKGGWPQTVYEAKFVKGKLVLKTETHREGVFSWLVYFYNPKENHPFIRMFDLRHVTREGFEKKLKEDSLIIRKGIKDCFGI